MKPQPIAIIIYFATGGIALALVGILAFGLDGVVGWLLLIVGVLDLATAAYFFIRQRRRRLN